ncbi:GNAT family N-acetyltransferase [Curvibacter sp. APW13]|uniref:GNAT family N-acetyltransferase n=1 Tax=Curvibacter sp. APW13 TaxID=3077236 RepID=UPI0028DF10E2|nr:GNAT family N-acetyltransferase [Curvibacter sp. APW13]MDT8992131.1 GNAT family N-acetyltransferase [Curvibacter sp. APW13]
MSMDLLERIERATLDAVSPERVEELPGWLLPMDPGTVGRAHSAVPTHHAAPPEAVLLDIAGRYRQAGFRPVLRLPTLDSWHGIHAALEARGWRRGKPTCVMTASTAEVLARSTPTTSRTGTVALTPTASEAWMALFLGQGLDPVDGASRARSLARSRTTQFAQVVEDGETVACGAACYSQGLLSAHGLRTAMAQRGQGHATALLHAMAAQGLRLGMQQAFLQVEAANPARALYERLGFALAWQYEYWIAA